MVKSAITLRVRLEDSAVAVQRRLWTASAAGHAYSPLPLLPPFHCDSSVVSVNLWIVSSEMAGHGLQGGAKLQFQSGE